MFEKLLDKIFDWVVKIGLAIDGFWERHICMDYAKTNLPWECADCNLGTCKKCPLEGMTRDEVEVAKTLGKTFELNNL